MPDMERARPGAGSGTGAKTAGEHVPTSVTDQPSAWLCRRGGDPVRNHRRYCRAFDRWALSFYGEELCARYGITSAARNPEPYAAAGMTLGVPERESA